VVRAIYNGYVAGTTKLATRTPLKGPKTKAIRQSVSIPAPLAVEVRRVARERHLTVSRALVTLAERGIRAEQDAKENLRATYGRFLKEQEPAKKDEAGRDLIRAVFGKDAIAEDPIL
jgi:hypothetical protein